ncbi:hypothetical protein B296_00041380 [Ensete ventricosum]|uniref:Uncharacterized protein n=1 Tax=Ensete ventricosum TaxID=4639 RepID=A0A426Z9B9_ENSVE|nr:hypothetical protein B296_00041380 [Ensete ventricosum]
MGTTRFGSPRRWGSPSLSRGRTLVRKDLHLGREPRDEAPPTIVCTAGEHVAYGSCPTVIRSLLIPQDFMEITRCPTTLRIWLLPSWRIIRGCQGSHCLPSQLVLLPGRMHLGHVNPWGRRSIITPIIPPSPREEASPRFGENAGEGPLDLESSYGVIRTSAWSSIARLLGKPSVDAKSTLEGMVGNMSPWTRLRARLEMIDTESPQARLRARLEMLRTESPRARSTTIVSSSGGAALADLGATDALTAMRSYFNVDLIVTTRRLVEVRKNYFVPPEYELNAPQPGAFLLSPMTKVCLEGWQISPSLPDGAQLVALSGGFLVGMLWVGHNGDPGVIHGLFPLKSGASWVLPDCSQWIQSGRYAF